MYYALGIDFAECITHSDFMRFVKDIFAEFGGNGVIAEITGEKYPTVSSWLVRCSIPPKHWAALVAAAPAHGVTLTTDTMIAIAANRDEEKLLRAREADARKEIQAEPAQ
ncbi:MAG: hypothetical protein ABJL57_11915 [Hyphomonas sp.]|uniref:carph-isopro domain-containing protein n=2 Tax=Hyphomonas sp. TaxID=87 RepID=UPI0032635C58